MTLPSSIGSASHFDQGSDDPKQARAQLKQIRNDIETINEHLKLSPFIAPSTPLGIGEGLESSGGNVRAKLDGSTLARSANGLKIADDAIDLAQLAHATAGDLPYYGASGVPARLAKGADGQVLTLALGVPAWSDSGSAWTEISGSPFDITGAADTGSTLATIFDSDSDKSFKVLFDDVRSTGTPAAASKITAFVGGSEQSGNVYFDNNDDLASNLGTSWDRFGAISWGTGEGLALELIVHNPGANHGVHMLHAIGHCRQSTTGAQQMVQGGWGVRVAGALNGLKLKFDSPKTIDFGACRVFKK